jgi:prepilin-type N-terminal cleavage/methylation domain-containing protein
MTRRSGVTLIEVLVSIFIMGIGLLSILVLFPLGAMSMYQAIKDDRCAQAGHNAEALAAAHSWRFDPNVTAVFQADAASYPAGYTGPSRPVFADPIGVRTAGMAAPYYTWLGGYTPPPAQVMTNIPRVDLSTGLGPSATTSQYLALRQLSLLDEHAFDANGLVPNPNDRDLRVTWAYLFRRPNARVSSVVDMTVVVYHGRTIGAPSPETAYAVYSAPYPGSTVQLAYAGQERPALRKGAWILDITQDSFNPVTGPIHSYFYRVVSVADFAAGVLELEVQPALRASLQTVLVMEGVAEVFEKGPGWNRNAP